MLQPFNTGISWGTYALHEMFNFISISKPPATSPFSFSYQYIPNGNYRKIATTNTENTLQITVSRDVETDKDNFATLAELFTSGFESNLSITNLTTGEVLFRYSKAILTNNDWLEGINDGSGADVILNFSCVNKGL